MLIRNTWEVAQLLHPQLILESEEQHFNFINYLKPFVVFASQNEVWIDNILIQMND